MRPSRPGPRVIMAIDEALFCGQLNPILFARCSRRHKNCAEFLRLYDAWLAGVPFGLVVQLDDPALRRRASHRRKANAAARKARRRNR